MLVNVDDELRKSCSLVVNLVIDDGAFFDE